MRNSKWSPTLIGQNNVVWHLNFYLVAWGLSLADGVEMVLVSWLLVTLYVVVWRGEGLCLPSKRASALAFWPSISEKWHDPNIIYLIKGVKYSH